MNPHSTPEHSLSADRPDSAQRRESERRATARNDAPGRGGGLPARPPQPERDTPGEALNARHASTQSSLRLPHERDEDSDMTNPAVQPRIQQAAQDLERGLKDTSRANETDQAYHRLHEGAAPAAARPPRQRK